MSRTTCIAALATSGALAVSLALPGLAKAVDSAPPVSRVTSASDRVDVDSASFAGYVAPLGKKKTIVGTFTVPILECKVGMDEGILSLIELAADGGAQYVDGAVYSYCVGGQATHSPVFDTTSSDGQVVIAEMVEDGDKITVESKSTKGKIKVTMTDTTRDWSVTDKFTGFTPTEGSSLQYLISVDEILLAPLSQDSAVKGVKISGQNLNVANPTKYVLVDGAGSPLIRPSKIKRGTNFTFKYVG